MTECEHTLVRVLTDCCGSFCSSHWLHCQTIVWHSFLCCSVTVWEGLDLYVRVLHTGIYTHVTCLLNHRFQFICINKSSLRVGDFAASSCTQTGHAVLNANATNLACVAIKASCISKPKGTQSRLRDGKRTGLCCPLLAHTCKALTTLIWCSSLSAWMQCWNRLLMLSLIFITSSPSRDSSLPSRYSRFTCGVGGTAG